MIINLAGKNFDTSEKRVLIITLRPQDMEALLSLNTRNRKICEHWISELMRRRRDSEWVYNADVIRISTKGVLLDGQHRLKAHLRLNVALECVLAFGVDEKAWVTIDGCRTRRASQEMQRNGIENATLTAAVLVNIIRYRNRGSATSWSTKYTHQQLMDVLNDHPTLLDIVRLWTGSMALKKLGGSAVAVFTLYLAKIALNDTAFEKFVGQLDGTVPATSNSPAFQWRDRLKENNGKSRLSKREMMALGIKAVSQFKIGKTTKFLRWTSSGNTVEPFPTVDGVEL